MKAVNDPISKNNYLVKTGSNTNESPDRIIEMIKSYSVQANIRIRSKF